MTIVFKTRFVIPSSPYCRLLSFLLFSQLLFPILCKGSKSPQWHRNICQFTQSLLYVPEQQLSFEGQFTPLNSNPSQQQLQSYKLITWCLIYPQYGPTHPLNSFVNNGGNGSGIKLLNPILLSQRDADTACLFGCIRILYSISMPKSSTEIYVVIVTRRESRSCPKQKKLLVSNVNRNQYATQKYNTFNSYSKIASIQNVRGKRYRTDRKWSSRQQLDLKNLKIRNHCIPQKSASSESQSKSESDKPYNEQLCTKILEALLNRPKKKLSVNSILDVSNNPVIELFDVGSTSPTPTAQCLLPWESKRLIAQPFSAETKLHCVFGCTRRFLQFRKTGEIAEFLFVRNCEPDIFRRCAIGLSSCCSGLTAFSTTGATRMPVSAILNVTHPSNDRAKVVKKAIQELRKRPGFNSLASESIVETRVEKRSGSWYKVILWMELSVAEF